MSIFRGLICFPVSLIILVSLVCLTTLPSPGYCEDEWVYVGTNDDFTSYYNKSSIKIDEQNQIIKVWVKHTFTDNKREQMIKINGIECKDIDNEVLFVFLNYRDWKVSVHKLTDYSTTDKVINSNNSPTPFFIIPPNSPVDLLLNKLIEDYNIQR